MFWNYIYVQVSQYCLHLEQVTLSDTASYHSFGSDENWSWDSCFANEVITHFFWDHLVNIMRGRCYTFMWFFLAVYLYSIHSLELFNVSNPIYITILRLPSLSFLMHPLSISFSPDFVQWSQWFHNQIELCLDILNNFPLYFNLLVLQKCIFMR